MRIAYVNYGMQSGVTPNIVQALTGLGHEIDGLAYHLCTQIRIAGKPVVKKE